MCPRLPGMSPGAPRHPREGYAPTQPVCSIRAGTTGLRIRNVRLYNPDASGVLDTPPAPLSRRSICKINAKGVTRFLRCRTTERADLSKGFVLISVASSITKSAAALLLRNSRKQDVLVVQKDTRLVLIFITKTRQRKLQVFVRCFEVV